jgi:hypothetical protein
MIETYKFLAAKSIPSSSPKETLYQDLPPPRCSVNSSHIPTHKPEEVDCIK